jgi:hypothetical protein
MTESPFTVVRKRTRREVIMKRKEKRLRILIACVSGVAFHFLSINAARGQGNTETIAITGQ